MAQLINKLGALVKSDVCVCVCVLEASYSKFVLVTFGGITEGSQLFQSVTKNDKLPLAPLATTHV